MNQHEPLPPRPRSAVMFMAAPVILGLLLLIAGGLVFVLGLLGGKASGPRLEVRMATSCPQQVASIAVARAKDVGMGDPVVTVDDGVVDFVATMPGLDDDRTAMPRLLSRGGHLRITPHGSDEVLATEADIKSVDLRLDEAGIPYAHVLFDPAATERLAKTTRAHPEGSLDIAVDDDPVIVRPNRSRSLDDGELRIVNDQRLPKDRMRLATDTVIVLRHPPMPCDVKVLSVTDAG